MSRSAVALLAVLVTTCANPPTLPPEPAVAMPRVVFPDGYAVHVELATDAEVRAQGLMFRDRLPSRTGMLFFLPEAGVHPFWMKNTLIPLDIIWIDETKRVVHVKHDVPPCRADPCPNHDPGVPALYVLEVAAGVARQHGVTEGAELRFEGLDNVVGR